MHSSHILLLVDNSNTTWKESVFVFYILPHSDQSISEDGHFLRSVHLNAMNSMVLSNFSVFEQKYPFHENLVATFKIVYFKWNVVITKTLIRICRIQWWYSLFLFLTGNTLFGQIWTKKKIKIVSLSSWIE